MEDAKIRRTPHRNGFVVGLLVAAVTSIAFLAFFWNAYKPFEVVLLVGLPIGIALGVCAGLAVEGRAISPKFRNMVGLATLSGFLLYIVLLVLYLISHAG